MLVLDTSTLVLLAKADLLPLLAEKTSLVIPREVEIEALAKPALYDARVIAGLVQAGAIQVKKGSLVRRRQLEADFKLGVGEAAAMCLAMERSLPLGTDDGPAIKAAKILNVPFLTALHVVTALYEQGRVDRRVALAKLDALQRWGRYSISIFEVARAQLQKENG